MRIKVDHFYRTRDGRKAYIYRQHTLDINLFDGVIPNSDCAVVWGKNGNYYTSGKKSAFDLVAPWKDEPLKLEVGKRYRTRDGRIAFVITTFKDTSTKKFKTIYKGVIDKDTLVYWDILGHAYETGNSPDDLVECLDD